MQRLDSEPKLPQAIFLDGSLKNQTQKSERNLMSGSIRFGSGTASPALQNLYKFESNGHDMKYWFDAFCPAQI